MMIVGLVRERRLYDLGRVLDERALVFSGQFVLTLPKLRDATGAWTSPAARV